MNLRRLRAASLVTAGLLGAPGAALAVNPLEYPDNGSASFSRGGAWLATGTDPIAVHYNPAALPLQRSGASLEMQLNFNQVCFERLNPGGEPTGPRQQSDPSVAQGLQYREVCNAKQGFPSTVPSMALVWRATERLGVGVALVPPSAYGVGTEEWPAFAEGYNASRRVDAPQTVPAPYRYMTLGNQSLVAFPTLSAGYEVLPRLRIGAGFVWGMAVIGVSSASASSVAANDLGDHAADDSLSTLRTRDLFVPGFVASVHWSLSDRIDASVWGRWLSPIQSRNADVEIIGRSYSDDLGSHRPICQDPDTFSAECQGQAIRNRFSGDDFERFRLVIPPEIRAGIRYHEPRGSAPADGVRDPLRDDVFDVELNVSYTANSVSDVIQVRFRQDGAGGAVVPVAPVGMLPPNADRETGWRDSYGVRLGGQVNVLPSKLGIRAGTWIETAAVDAAYLNVSPVPALRGGFGGGIVLRQDNIDFQIGYQRHWNAGLDNGGDGAVRGTAGVLRECAGAGCPARGEGPEPPFREGSPPEDQQFRTFHAINGGRVTQSANVFTLGAILRF